MNNEERIKSGFKGDLKELEIAWNHFEFCEPEFIDCAIDDLVHAKKAFDRILKEIRNEKLDTSIFKT